MKQAPSSDPSNSAPPQASVLQRLRRVWPYFGQSRTAWGLAIASSAIAAATEAILPRLLQPLLDNGFRQEGIPIWIVPTTLLLLFGVRGLASFIGTMALAKITNQGLMVLRQTIFSKILTGRLALFASHSSSTLANTVVYEVQNGSSMLVNSVMSLVRDSLTVLAFTASLLQLNPKLTLIVAALIPAIAWVMGVLSRRLYQITKSSQTATDTLAYVVEENVLANRDIRLHAAQEMQARRFAGLSNTLRRLSMKSTAASAAMAPITQMLVAVALSAVITLALLQSASSGTSVGSFVAFVTTMLMMVAPIKRLSDIAAPITRGLAAVERGLDLVDATADETGGHHAPAQTAGNLRFIDTSLVFPEASTPALDRINLSIKAGETVALVGASGAGKTTLVSLLPRFLDPSSGRVELDGTALGDWQLDALRGQFALVSQHVVMLNDSIAFNVALGLEIDRDKVARCLADAHLDQFVAELPEGMDTQVGHNATQLSGGQRQRLAIARALYKNAPVLILDEATSALDTESERAVQEALQRLMKNRTTLVIAHRLSTVHHADRIVVMDAGRIVETGNHAQLIAQDGPYARLYRLGLH